MALTDIDAFLIGCAERYARSTVADIAGSVRCLARFLLATGHISIEAGRVRRFARAAQVRAPPPRLAMAGRAAPAAPPWTLPPAQGLRDYALLLMMSTYGFPEAGEVICLQLQDIDWTAATLKVMRPKTGVAFTLPLLPAAAKALALYCATCSGRRRPQPGTCSCA